MPKDYFQTIKYSTEVGSETKICCKYPESVLFDHQIITGSLGLSSIYFKAELNEKKMLLHQKELLKCSLWGNLCTDCSAHLPGWWYLFSSSDVLNTHVRLLLAFQEENLIENVFPPAEMTFLYQKANQWCC